MDSTKDMGDVEGTRKSEPTSPAGQGSVMLSWLRIAYGEMDTTEVEGSEHNPRILEYHRTTSLRATTDETPWCSSFVNWCMRKAGYKGTDSARALSWATWGEAVSDPTVGAIAVFKRRGGGHVGFVLSHDPYYVTVLGGNQGNKVSIRQYSMAQLVGFRMPSILNDADDATVTDGDA